MGIPLQEVSTGKWRMPRIYLSLIKRNCFTFSSSVTDQGNSGSKKPMNSHASLTFISLNSLSILLKSYHTKMLKFLRQMLSYLFEKMLE